MKRLIVLTILLLIATSSSGCCRRGSGLWGLRGARCGAPMAPTYTPVPSYAPPAYAPPVCPPSTIQEVPCDPCSTYGGGYGSTDYGASFGSAPMISRDSYPGSTYDGGVIYGDGAASFPPSLPIPTTPIESGSLPRGYQASNAVLGVPIYSHTLSDRKLVPGETLNGEMVPPMESAAAKEPNETK